MSHIGLLFNFENKHLNLKSTHCWNQKKNQRMHVHILTTTWHRRCWDGNANMLPCPDGILTGKFKAVCSFQLIFSSLYLFLLGPKSSFGWQDFGAGLQESEFYLHYRCFQDHSSLTQFLILILKGWVLHLFSFEI